MIENRAVGIKSREVYEAPGRDHADRRALRARGRRPDEGRGAHQAPARAALDGARLRRSLVQPGARGDRRVRRHDAGARHGRGAASSCGRTPRSSRGAARSTCSTPRRSPRTAPGETFPHEAAEGFIRISALETELARGPRARARDQGIIGRAWRTWSGRVRRARSIRTVWEFLRVDDAELLPYDCEATAEHARRLHAAGLLDGDELAEVERRLAEIAQDPSGYLDSDEDVHSAIERQLGEVGPQDPRGSLAQRPGRGGVPALRARRVRRGARRDRRARAGRPLVRRGGGGDVDARLHAPPARAAGHARPPPARLGRDARPRPHALRGSPPTLRPRARSARARSPARRSTLPPPPRQMRNSIDAVADRDFALDYLYAAAVLFTHLSRIGEEIVLWATAEFGFVRLPETRRDGLVDDAAEAEPGRRRARARQGRHRDRAAHRAARDREGPAARVRPRPAGGQGAGLRRAARDCGSRSRRSPSSSAGSRSTATRLAEAAARSAAARDRRGRERSCVDGVPFRDAHEQVAATVRERNLRGSSRARRPRRSWTRRHSCCARGRPVALRRRPLISCDARPWRRRIRDVNHRGGSS